MDQKNQAKYDAHGRSAVPRFSLLRPPVIYALAALLVAGTAYGLARSIWEFDGFAIRIVATQAQCQNNLKQMGLVLKIFSGESAGEVFPLRSPEPDNLFIEWYEIYPEYLTDPDILVCPGPAGEPPEDRFTDKYYVYTGFVLRTQEDLEAYAGAAVEGADYSQNLPVPSSYDPDEIYRIRNSIERFLITDINDPGAGYRLQSEIPVLWEWPDNHDAGHGANVLYMDGHVEWVNFGDKFPVTAEATAVLAELADYEPPTDWSPNHYQPTYGNYSPFPPQCAWRMKQLGLVSKMYANEADGEFWPLLSSEGGRIMVDPSSVYPEYSNDPIIYTCPGRVVTEDLPEINDSHFAYLGYFLLNDDDVQQFAIAYNEVIANGGDFSANLPVESSYGSEIRRLKEGIERFIITDINQPGLPFAPQSQIPVFVEWPENHEGLSGGHVLFMDGHVEWMPYPGEFPMTESTIGALRTLAQNTPANTWAVDEGPEDMYGHIGSCENRLRHWGAVGDYYENESHGRFRPPLSLTPGNLAPRDEAVYPDYAPDRYIGVCPGASDEEDIPAYDDRHYVYTGYVLLTDGDAQAFAAAYAAELAGGGDFSDALPVASSYGDSLVRFRQVDPYLFSDPENWVYRDTPARLMPYMFEWPGNHEGQTGGNVLYMDGHVEWHDYPGRFPMTEATIAALAGIADWSPVTEWAPPPYPRLPDTHDQQLCLNNERMFGLAFKIFSNGADGNLWPPLSAEENTLMVDHPRYLRYYLRDTRRMNCPGSPNAHRQPEVDDHSYAYLGYLVRDQEELELFATAYQQQIASGGDFTEDLAVGEDTVSRLREGIERFLITDINNPAQTAFTQRRIPVMVEWPDNHGELRGGNVLYMDGHSEWLAYPGEFPMTEEAMAILTELAGRGPIAPAPPGRTQTLLEALIGGN